jgi:hypothetical protein
MRSIVAAEIRSSFSDLAGELELAAALQGFDDLAHERARRLPAGPFRTAQISFKGSRTSGP